MKRFLYYYLFIFALMFISCAEEEKSLVMPSLIETSPEDEEQNIDIKLPEIVLTFNKSVYIATSDLNKLTLEPNAKIDEVLFSDEVITLKVSGLKPETDYILTIPEGIIYDDDEQTSGEINLSFRTGGVLVSNEPDKTGMESDGFSLFKKIKVGWCLGNVLESYEENITDHMDSETSWGNPRVERWMIDAVKNAGFNAVRIPVRWYPHVVDQSTMAEIKVEWLNRVKEVVDYCIDNDMYVILNTHHEDWLESHPLKSEAEAVLAKERNLWRAIATFFKDYDEHLIFSGTNEVEINWQVPTASNLEVQNSFNQCFVDAVRSTGGKNYYRNLIIQTYATNPDYAFPDFYNGKLIYPTDVVENRIAIEFHYYRPAGFSYMDFADYTETVYYWGKDYIQYNKPGTSNEQEDYVDWLFAKIKQTWVDEGYPVVMGEYGVVTTPKDKSDANINDLADTKRYYMKYITSAAKKNGIVPIVWDNGTFYNPLYGQSFEEGKEFFGIFNRWWQMEINNYSQPILEGVMEGAETEYPY